MISVNMLFLMKILVKEWCILLILCLVSTLSGMDRDYGPGSYGGLTFQDIYLKILLLSASKGEHHLIFFLFKLL